MEEGLVLLVGKCDSFAKELAMSNGLEGLEVGGVIRLRVFLV